MKTILIATDFSHAADNAARYAVELASVMNARVILFSAYQQVPFAVPEMPVMITEEDIHVSIDEQLADTARQLTNHRQVWVITGSKPGMATSSIVEAVAEYKPDIVIAGMKKNAHRRLFGSTVTALIRRLQVPLMVIPEDAVFSPVNAIALANESDLPAEADPHVLDALKDLSQRFHSKLYLARVVNNNVKFAYTVKPPHLSALVATLDPQFRCIEGENIVEALMRFIKLFGINVLAMLPHKHSMLERMFISSVTKEMAFITRIPLLVLPERKG